MKIENEKIVYHPAFKFGKVLKQTNNNYSVLFDDNKIKSIIKSDSFKFITEVDEDLCNFIESEEFYAYIDGQSISRGESYQRNGRVKAITYDENKKVITSDVEGNHTYVTNISLVNNRPKMVCSCPVGVNCKHVAATLIDINKRFRVLSKDNKAETIKSNEKTDLLTPSLKNKIGELRYTTKPLYTMKVISNYLKNEILNPKLLAPVFDYAYTILGSKYKVFLESLYLDSKLRKIS